MSQLTVGKLEVLQEESQLKSGAVEFVGWLNLIF